MIGPESIEFEEGIFNQVYYELDEAFNNELIRFIFLYGGSSSSKTFSYVQKTIVYMMEDSGNNSLIFRKFSTDIEGSIFQDFKNIIEDWGLSSYFKIQKHYIECLFTSSYVRFKGLDDSEKIKGLSGIKKICLEEFSQFDMIDFKQVKKRLRGSVGQQIIGIFNPVSEMSFIKTEIFDNEIFEEQYSKIQSSQINSSGDTLVLRTCYLDNIWIVGDGKGGGFIDHHVIADFERDKLNDINYYNIYALGQWGKLRTGGEFLKQFDSNKHVGDYKYNPSEPLHIVFDENVLPYLTCNVFQLQNGLIRQIDEIMLKDPLNTLKDTCEEFLKRYGNNMNGLFVYGDATSKKQDTKLQKGQNFYLLIKGYLSKLKPTFRIPKANPSVIMSRNFTNDLLAGSIDGLSIGFDAKCRNSINDYQYCTEDAEGKVNKKLIRDKVTGRSWQEFGHASDCLRYILTAMFQDYYKKFMKGN
jgi:phage terminase large subunit